MATKSLEERLDILEAQNKALEHENERLRAARECENVINRYSYKLLFGPVAECADCFALQTPGARVTIGPWGSWEGRESAEKSYTKFHTLMTFGDYNGSARAPGVLMADSNGEAIIEVAKDGKTAKELLIVIGATRSGSVSIDEQFTGQELGGVGLFPPPGLKIREQKHIERR